MSTPDTVSLMIPLKPEYVSIARLTASGIANQAGFDFDTIEDIKVSISEVIAKIIERRIADKKVVIDFVLLEDGLSISLIMSDQSVSKIFSDDEDDFALAIISTLMDEISLQTKESTVINMVKRHGKAV